MDIELKPPRSMGVRVSIVLGGLLAGYLFYGSSLFIVALKHMNPNLPPYYFWVTLIVQVFPLLVSALAWLMYLVKLKPFWLWISGLSWGFVAISVVIFQVLIR